MHLDSPQDAIPPKTLVNQDNNAKTAISINSTARAALPNSANPAKSIAKVLELPISKSLINIANEAARGLALQVASIDTLIRNIDYLLNDLQPPLTGKIRIEFHQIDGLLRPVPIVWRRSSADNAWRYDKVGWARLSLRAKTARQFWDNRALVAELLSTAAQLARMRSDLIRSLTTMPLSICSRRKVVRPKTIQIDRRLREVLTERNAGKHFTFITKHTPTRVL